MQQQLNLVQVSVAARAFLDWQEVAQDPFGLGDDISWCRFELSGYKCVLECCKEKRAQPTAMEWHPWVSAALTEFPLGTTISKDTQVSALQGYRIMQTYVYDYACRMDCVDLKMLSQAWKDTSIESFQSSKQWKYWLLCIDAVLHEKTEGLGLLTLDTLITKQQSLEIMQQFFKDYCLKTQDIKHIEWFERVQNWRLDEIDIMLQDWLASFPAQTADTLNVSDAFQVMQRFIGRQRFVEKHRAVNFKDLKILSNYIGKGDPSHSMLPAPYNAWMHAAYTVIFN